ncbi:MAG: DNA primase [Candidatus Nanopelagicaceae bacterium]
MSSRLVLFARKKADLYNFRCPYCGDSQKRRNKARGYLFKIKNDFVFKCHNCGMGRTLANFLKDQDTFLHDQYVMEKFKDGKTGKGTTVPNPKFEFKEPKFVKKDTGLEKISDLNISHPAREYLENRGIKDLEYFYYCPKFKEWTNKQKKMFDNLKQDSPRIIIPFKDKQGNLFGYQGRSLAPKAKLRYITIMLDEEQPKIFGLDRINETETVYVTEGPFDSMFIRNSIAMCGSDVELSSLDCQFVYIYDNEPRNKQIVERIDKTIRQGNKVVIWPKNIQQKDINDMVLAGLNVQNVVESNVYSGLEATLKLNDWKKV